MCEEKVTGIMPGFLIGRGQTRPPPCDGSCHQPASARLSPTQYAQRVLAVCGGIVVLASAGAILRGLLIAVAVVLALAVAAAGGWLWHRVRSLRQRQYIVPAPLPAPARTVVTGVSVRAIEPGRRAGDPVLRDRAPGRRARG
jgi:hypothetical protein